MDNIILLMTEMLLTSNLTVINMIPSHSGLYRPATESFELIRLQRQTFYTKSYNEQNYILSRQMEVKLCASGHTRVIYKLPSIGVVRRGAFKKVYGFSNAKIKFLLEKIQADGVSIEQDM